MLAQTVASLGGIGSRLAQLNIRAGNLSSSEFQRSATTLGSRIRKNSDFLTTLRSLANSATEKLETSETVNPTDLRLTFIARMRLPVRLR